MIDSVLSGMPQRYDMASNVPAVEVGRSKSVSTRLQHIVNAASARKLLGVSESVRTLVQLFVESRVHTERFATCEFTAADCSIPG